VAPRNEQEKIITGIWKRLLGIEEVGIQDDIFELGADSLLLVEFHKELIGVVAADISIVDLYKYKNAEALAAHLSQDNSGADQDIQSVLDRAKLKKDNRERKSANMKRRRLNV